MDAFSFSFRTVSAKEAKDRTLDVLVTADGGDHDTGDVDVDVEISIVRKDVAKKREVIGIWTEPDVRDKFEVDTALEAPMTFCKVFFNMMKGAFVPIQ